jgi:alpha-L-fucosidase 2
MKKGEKDANLDAFFFQYARYLVIAGSRSDSPLPLHLQGIWNDSLAASMGWTCDYHLDINTEQNYWLTEVGNLTECGEPLFQFVERLQIPGHKTAQKVYGITNGWVCHVFSNPWGFTAPGWSDGWGLHVTGGLWISTHLWEHYEYTRDSAFLASRAYPVLKSEAEFFLSYLYPDPSTGFLSTGPSVSPERGGETGPGPVHDRALVYELFRDCIQATEILGVDPELHSRLVSALNSFRPTKSGEMDNSRSGFITMMEGKRNTDTPVTWWACSHYPK